MNSYAEINRLLILRAEKNRTNKMLIKRHSTSKSFEDEDALELKTRKNQRNLRTAASLTERQRVDSNSSMSSSNQFLLSKFANTNTTPDIAKSIMFNQRSVYLKQQSEISSSSVTPVNTRKKLEPLVRKSTVNKAIHAYEVERAHISSKSTEENLKRVQRKQIYALNQLMTKLEHENFLKFCLENNIDSNDSI